MKCQFAKTFSRDESVKTEKILASLPRESTVLDVGCGLGKKIELLKRLGFQNVLGVEKNLALVDRAVAYGFHVVDVKEFERSQKKKSFDLLVMSHVIEHFQFPELMEFMNFYLDYLKPGGHVLIISPLLHKEFYLDFDHIKPYYPQGIKVFFGENDEQISNYSRHTLKLRDIYFRKSPFKIRLNRKLLLKKRTFLPHLGNLILALGFRFSGKLFGRKTGWLGLYRKV